MTMETVTCEICGNDFSPKGISGHKESQKCYANAKGTRLSRSIIVEGNKKPTPITCVLCEETIEEGEKAVLIPALRGSERNNYFHLKHLSQEFLGKVTAEAL